MATERSSNPLTRAVRRMRRREPKAQLRAVVAALGEAPLDGEAHLSLAELAARLDRPWLAAAELASARWLGADPARLAELESAVRSRRPDPLGLDHNQHYRYVTLARAVREAVPDGGAILDVGGGEGQLASFLPGRGYCLAEPTVNGISGVRLPFEDGTFDAVVACHVLEHVPIPEREAFLDQLLAKSRGTVILLGPFEVDGGRTEERLRLFHEITGARWAAEHLECSLPELEDVRRWAERRDLAFDAEPNGSLATAAALVFADHFAQRAGEAAAAERVARFFNALAPEALDSERYPNAWLTRIRRR